MKLLHVSYHEACFEEIKYLSESIGFEATHFKYNDGYNIGHDRAKKSWEKYKDYFNTFDFILTSDTAPLSRIFLQNNFRKHLIIWVCNRFDYYDAASLDCRFPDEEYYDMIRHHGPNVQIISYTPFEHEYARRYRNVEFGTLSIKPTGMGKYQLKNKIIPKIMKQDAFLITTYHNDVAMNVTERCEILGIKTYGGHRYNGPNDLIGFKGIIHIPYAWSNFALFENWQRGLVYFIPTKKFLLTFQDFFWSPPFVPELLELSEWYCNEHKELMIFFDSWEELGERVKINIESYKQNIKEFCTRHVEKTLQQWRAILI